MIDDSEDLQRLQVIALSAGWPAIEDKVGPTIAAVLALNKYVNLEKILSVRIGALVFLRGSTTIVSCQESATSTK